MYLGEEASSYGIMEINSDKRIIDFVEKPSTPPISPIDSTKSLASMGIYIFTMDALIDALEKNAADINSKNDFGHDIIPKLIQRESVYAYRFGEESGRVSQDVYWRDVGTIDSFYQANMDLLQPIPPLDLYQQDWAIRTYEQQLPPARTVSSTTKNSGQLINSIISNGVIISDASVYHSILSSNVRIFDNCSISNSIVFDNVEIGKGCQIQNCIIDKNVKIPAGTRIGFDTAGDKKRYKISEKGIVVVPEEYQFTL